MKIYDRADNITQQYFSKIGEVVVLLSWIDSWIEYSLWELINANGDSQKVGRRITASLSFQQKRDLFKSLIAERNPNKLNDNFQKLDTLLKECNDIRNDVAHSQWFIRYGSTKEELTTVKFNSKKMYDKKKKFVFIEGRKEVTLEELTKFSLIVLLT